MEKASEAAPIHIGIGGWTYPAWRGLFYPPGLPHARELAYVGEHLTGTEVNATFYRRQSPSTFARWRDTVPDGFRFALKGSRYCTTRRDLAQAGESIANFMAQGLVELGDKLGPINWQLADTKRFDADEIGAFLALLPHRHEGHRIRHAIEARHESFDDPAFYTLCRDAGRAVVMADTPRYAVMDAQAAAGCTPFVYLRLQNARTRLKRGYPDAELDKWTERIRAWSQGGQEVFAFFINGAKERAPAAAMRLIDRLNR